MDCSSPSDSFNLPCLPGNRLERLTFNMVCTHSSSFPVSACKDLCKASVSYAMLWHNVNIQGGAWRFQGGGGSAPETLFQRSLVQYWRMLMVILSVHAWPGLSLL